MNTTSHDPLQDPPGDDLLAGEYVLGVLDADTRRAVAARVSREPALAREVAGWEGRLVPMLEEIESVTPSPGTWRRVRMHVGLSTAPAPARLPQWERLGFWRGVSATALVATAASLFALLVWRQPLPSQLHSPHPITMLTTIANTDGSPAFIAAVDADACTMLVMPTDDASVPAGKVAELWVIAGDGAPRSLGVRSTSDMQAIPVPVGLRDLMQVAATLAVSVEPRGGSATGLPTGQVIATGTLTRLTL